MGRLRLCSHDDQVAIVDVKRLLKENGDLSDHQVMVNGRSYLVLESVFSPAVWPNSEFSAKLLPFPSGKRFLEVGCGSGCISIEAALSGCNVTAVDVTLQAIEYMPIYFSNLLSGLGGSRHPDTRKNTYVPINRSMITRKCFFGC